MVLDLSHFENHPAFSHYGRLRYQHQAGLLKAPLDDTTLCDVIGLTATIQNTAPRDSKVYALAEVIRFKALTMSEIIASDPSPVTPVLSASPTPTSGTEDIKATLAAIQDTLAAVVKVVTTTAGQVEGMAERIKSIETKLASPPRQPTNWSRITPAELKTGILKEITSKVDRWDAQRVSPPQPATDSNGITKAELKTELKTELKEITSKVDRLDATLKSHGTLLSDLKNLHSKYLEASKVQETAAKFVKLEGRIHGHTNMLSDIKSRLGNQPANAIDSELAKRLGDLKSCLGQPQLKEVISGFQRTCSKLDDVSSALKDMPHTKLGIVESKIDAVYKVVATEAQCDNIKELLENMGDKLQDVDKKVDNGFSGCNPPFTMDVNALEMKFMRAVRILETMDGDMERDTIRRKIGYRHLLNLPLGTHRLDTTAEEHTDMKNLLFFETEDQLRSMPFEKLLEWGGVATGSPAHLADMEFSEEAKDKLVTIVRDFVGLPPVSKTSASQAEAVIVQPVTQNADEVDVVRVKEEPVSV